MTSLPETGGFHFCSICPVAICGALLYYSCRSTPLGCAGTEDKKLNTPTLTEVVSALRNGTFDADADLTELEHEIELRRKRAERRLLHELDYGDIVRFHGMGMGAKYLEGALARVVDVKMKRVVVQVTEMRISEREQRGKRFQVGSRIITYPSHLRKVNVVEGTSRPAAELLTPGSRFVDQPGEINVTPPEE